MAEKIRTKRQSQQRQAIVRILLLVGILFFINLLASRFHAGLDLTQDKRFTLSNATKAMLRSMDDVAVVDIYLVGELPAGFKKLASATTEKLDQLRSYSDNQVVYRTVDAFEGIPENAKIKKLQELAKKGIYGTNLQMKTEEGYSEKVILPYALIQYKGKEYPVSLLESEQAGMSAFQALNYSESLLEYKFASGINYLSRQDRHHIAYIMGHNENLGNNTIDLFRALSKFYVIDTLDLPGSIHIPGPGLGLYDAIIINNPKSPFTDQDKFKIDQYLMRGGKLLYCADGVGARMDSMGSNQSFLTGSLDLNMDDLLFENGVRINANLIEDKDCNPIPVVVGQIGDQAQTELRSWIYFPVFLPSSRHPIVHNLDPVLSTFASSIDTIANPDLKKTVLLSSSKYSRVAPHPVRVSLTMMAYKPDYRLFNKPYQPFAVLVEGKFKSLFRNRMTPEFKIILKDSLRMPFLAQADTGSGIIAIADGDVFENDFTEKDGALDMGYWRFTGNRFSNRAFLLNCMEHLVDKSGLLESRSKDVKLRLLDVGRVKTENTKWQVINIGIPVLLVIVFASVYLFIRKRKYAS